MDLIGILSPFWLLIFWIGLRIVYNYGNDCRGFQQILLSRLFVEVTACLCKRYGHETKYHWLNLFKKANFYLLRLIQACILYFAITRICSNFWVGHAATLILYGIICSYQNPLQLTKAYATTEEWLFSYGGPLPRSILFEHWSGQTGGVWRVRSLLLSS